MSLRKNDEFPSKSVIQEIVDRAAFSECYHYLTKKSDRRRLVIGCSQASCKWGLRASKIPQTDFFRLGATGVSIHALGTSQSDSNDKRKGSAELVSAFLNEEFPGGLETPSPKVTKGLVKFKLGVMITYSTALHGKNLAVCDQHGNPEDSYKMMYSYLYMLK